MDKDRKKIMPAVAPTQWGQPDENHFGYASDEERRAKRGLEDWELVETIPESQRGVPFWFVGIIITVLLVAIGLSFPFWGNRPGVERDWFDWGFVAALFYIAAASALVYFMVNLYGSTTGGKLESDKSQEPSDER
jgi:hypothetical protein